jgi:L-asparagine transporter-like permease
MAHGCVLDLLKDDDDMTKVHLQRRLGFKESFAIVVGSIIGTGVFLKTAVMAQDAGGPPALCFTRVAGGRRALVHGGADIR